MRRIAVITILLILISFTSNSQNSKSNRYEIKGVLSNAPKECAIFLVNNVHKDTVSSTKIKNGKFKLVGVLETTPEWYSLHLTGQKEGVNIMLECSRINIRGTFDDWPTLSIEGSLSNAASTEFKEITAEYYRSFYEIAKEIPRAFEARDSIRFEYLRSLRGRIADTIYQLRAKFIIEHPNSKYTPWLIMNTSRFDFNRKQDEYNKLSEPVKLSNYGDQLLREIEKEKILSLIKVGNRLPNFISLSLAGDSLSMDEVIIKNKLTLIDFWASWCKPCRAETPNLNKVYSEFHNKGFNILSVSFDFKRKDWENAILRDTMPWIHVSELKGRDEYVGRLFGINGIPASILVDQKGKIVAIDAPGADIKSEGGSLRGESLYNKIETILGKSDSQLEKSLKLLL